MVAPKEEVYPLIRQALLATFYPKQCKIRSDRQVFPNGLPLGEGKSFFLDSPFCPSRGQAKNDNGEKNKAGEEKRTR